MPRPVRDAACNAPGPRQPWGAAAVVWRSLSWSGRGSLSGTRAQRLRRARLRAGVIGALTVALAAGALPAAYAVPPPQPRSGVSLPELPKSDPVPAQPGDPLAELNTGDVPVVPEHEAERTAAPAAAAVTQPVTGLTPGQTVPVGTTPLRVGAPAGATAAQATALQGNWQVSIADQATLADRDIEGIVFTMTPPATATGDAEIVLDYTGFAELYGADWADRLQLMRFPSCFLTTPQVESCMEPLDIDTENVVVPNPATDAPTDGMLDGTRQMRATVGVGTLTDPETPPASQAKTATGGGGTVPAFYRTPAEEAGAAPALPVSARSAFARQAASTGSSVMVATAKGGGSKGDFSATPLPSAGSWSAGTGSGGFSYTYGLQTPGVPAGPTPNLSFGYSSQSADGATSATNNQVSWIGDGWDYNAGSITRTYRSCRDDSQGGNNTTRKTGDLCWGSYNATLTLGGTTTELVIDDSHMAAGAAGPHSDKWVTANGDGSRVELIKDTDPNLDSGDQDGEYWRVTTRDGTQYYFGRHKLPGWSASAGNPRTTDSVLSVPVSGNQPGEPCYNASFASSFCEQAWRWNLDYVVDTHGNAMSLWWGRETNHYAANLKFRTPKKYHRGGWLKRIDYGQRESTLFTADPIARVLFDDEERCFTEAGIKCVEENFTSGDWAKTHVWYDTPADLYCSGAQGKDCMVPVPTFWTRKRLASVTTEAQRTPGSTVLKPVDRWTLQHSLPSTRTDESTALWLNEIQRQGFAPDGSGQKVNPVVFVANANPMPNRVKAPGDESPVFDRLRIAKIVNEYGGETHITYRQPTGPCATGTGLPAPAENTGLCFPAYWHPDPDKADERTHWFNKYVVEKVEELAGVPGTPTVQTVYQYEGGGAWALNQAEFSKKKTRTYDQWRGFELVRTINGADSADTYQGTERSQTETRFFRGMDGDRLPDTPGSTNNSRSVVLKDSKNQTIARDSLPFQGRAAESITYSKAGGVAVNREVDVPRYKVLATRARSGGIPDLVAHRVLEESSTTETLSSGTRTDSNVHTVDDTRTLRTTVTSTEYENTYDLPIRVESQGDTGVSGDETCARLSYVHNPSAHLIGLTGEARTTAGLCAGTTGASEVLSGARTAYDGTAFGGTPVHGLPTSTWDVTPDGSGWQAAPNATLTYDSYGRIRTSQDAAGSTDTTTYTPATGQVHSLTTANELGHTSVSEIEPGRATALKETDPNGLVTQYQYDALGRTVKAFAPGQPLSEPSVLFQYNIEAGRPSSVITRALTHDGYTSSVVFYDGLGRERQRQEPAVGKGRLVTDTLYSANGSIRRTNNGYYATGEPHTVMYAPDDMTDSKIPNATFYKYDGAGRLLAETPYEAGEPKPEKANKSEYGYDYSVSVPPAGGSAQRTWSDALGRTVRVDTFTDHGRTAFRSTAYTYDARGDLVTAKDPQGNAWSWAYDARGRQTSATDPDAGTSLTEYDAADRPVRTRDGRNTWVWTKYDALSRPTETRQDSATGTLLEKATYDTLPGAAGLPVSTTRYTGGNAYTQEVTGYNSDYQPLGTRLTLPPAIAAANGLQQTYSYSYEYSRLGRTDAVTVPAVGGLPQEKVVVRYNEDGLPVSTSGDDWYNAETVYSPYGEVLRTVSGEHPNRVWTSNLFDERTGELQRTVVDRQSTSDTSTVTGHRVNDRTYGYDLSGNVTSIADTTNGVTDRQCFTYDLLGQLTEAWTAPTSCTAAGKPNPAPEYPDGTKNVTAGNSGYWQSYRYDELGQRTSLTKHDPGLDINKDVRVDYTYGKANGTQPHTLTGIRTTSRTSTGAEIIKQGLRTYDDAGNTLTREDGAGSEQALSWTWDGKVETVTGFGENGAGAWTHAAGRCLDLSNASTIVGTALQSFSCNDTKAQRFRIDPASAATPDTGALKVLGKCAVPQGGATADGTPVVIADCNGDAGQKWQTIAAGKKLKHVASGRCLTVPGTAPPSGTDLQITACGADTMTAQSWTPANETTYIYGPGGERLLSLSSASTTLYLGESTITTSGGGASSTERYYSQPGAPTVVRRVTGSGAPKLSVQALDHNGTAHASVDLAAGNAVQFSRKDPFGAERAEHNSWQSKRGFIGGDNDAATGLVHLGAREYEPSTGRFLSADPLLDIADPVQMNGYVYADNNPVTFADPTGLKAAHMGGGGAEDYGAPSKGEQDWARQQMGTSMLDVILGTALGEFKQYILQVKNDIASCISRGDLWACGRILAEVIPASKVFKLTFKVGSIISKIAGAVSAWRNAQAKARKIIAQAKAAAEAARKAAAAKKAQAAKAAQLARQKAKEAATRAAKKAAQKTGNAVQKTKKVQAKKAENPVRSPVQRTKPAARKSSGSQSDSSRCADNSFVPGTLVLMADGSKKPIEQVRVGDRVVATDPETGETAVETVTAEIKGQGEKHLVEITIDTDGPKGTATAKVTATDGHPFWVPELREWIDATDLEAGDWLRTGAGTLVQISAVERWTASAAVHNLTVSDLHTYYVLAGATPVLVHNCGEVAVDTNIVSYSLSGTRAAEVETALAGRSPVLSPTAHSELLTRYSADEIGSWLSARGGRMGVEASQAGVDAIQGGLEAMWTYNFKPSIALNDRRVLQSAVQEGLTLLTTDKQILKNAPRLGLSVERFTF
jgi:RHS repeat-associated protein